MAKKEHLWKKGQSGNPNGRPKGSGKNQIFDALLEIDPAASKGMIAQELYKLAFHPDTEHKHKMTALSKLVDLVFEKPKEHIEVDNKNSFEGFQLHQLMRFKESQENEE